MIFSQRAHVSESNTDLLGKVTVANIVMMHWRFLACEGRFKTKFSITENFKHIQKRQNAVGGNVI